MKAIILAGGTGTRLLPYTYVLPKPLMPVGNLPILEIILRQLEQKGITEVILSVGYLAQLIQAYFGDGKRMGVNITYSREDFPLGTAGPLSLLSGLDSTFLVMNGDILTDMNYRELVEFHRRSGSIATVATFCKEIRIDLGIIEASREGLVREYVEKPLLTYNVSMGIYAFEPAVLQFVQKDCPLDLPTLIQLLVRRGECVSTFLFHGHWLDIGRTEDHAKAVELFGSHPELFITPPRA